MIQYTTLLKVASLLFFSIFFFQESNADNCPDIVAPVCGSNGVTYLNCCYAEQAGVTDFTPGVCFGDCIDPSQMDPYANCGYNYDPVCGCNGVTYLNACIAEANGVTSYTSGPCNSDCYDPILVVTSAGTTVDYATGIISFSCSDYYDPVCGCNGVTYTNSCYAEASGITYYTPGDCSTDCVDPWTMDPDPDCTYDYDPVCGCNGETYTNFCYAEAAGVTSYTYGSCGGSSDWCDEAIPIQCGDFLANETTVGAGNEILTYPGCSGYSFYGPDKVYMIYKTTAGDLQIGLEIITPDLDLDIFLLSGNCSQLYCLEASTTSNSLSNNEGIVLEDAPIGTYYLVVDGQFAGSEGEYRLEVNCGYLDCSEAVYLTCGEAYDGSNVDGDDNVSLYGCEGNVLNVENNGPEVVHYFTITEAGIVNISLTNLSANLELFLLRSCDRGDCIDYSQHSGASDEYISAYLDAGTYYVVVDGYNGAACSYTLYVDCSSACTFEISDYYSSPAGCGQNDGSITLSSSNGRPGYIVSWTGPVSGSFYTYSNTCTISGLPPGSYTITKTDANGCSDTVTVSVGSSGNLSIYAFAEDAVCSQLGSIFMTIYNGSPVYSVYVTGPVNTDFTTYSSTFSIANLPAGTYTIYVVDGNGCSASKEVAIEQNNSDFYFDATPNDALCESLGSISVSVFNGEPPYTVFVSGPISGSASTYSSNFDIINLPGGTYTISIEDANWCSFTQVVTIENADLMINATGNNGVCGEDGSIDVYISNGTPNYSISWSGPVSGSATTANSSFTIPNLPSGAYTISVTDANWCSDYQLVYIDNSGSNLSTDVIPIDGNCSQYGAIWIDINNGTPPFNISWNGPVSGATTTSNNWIDIPNLPAGGYYVTITDYNGCSDSHTVYINTGNDLAIYAEPVNGDCAQQGSIIVSISDGNPYFIISWEGPVSGAITTDANTYEITNLPSGAYTVTVTDASGCSASKTVYISNSEDGELDIIAVGMPGNCSQPGAIWLVINGESPPYSIVWNGPSSGSATTDDDALSIPVPEGGTYEVTVTGANGCSDSQTVFVEFLEDNLEILATPINQNCGDYGSISVNIFGGVAAFTLSWSGPVSGSYSTNGTDTDIPHLPAGTYTVTVTDYYGCSQTVTVTIPSGGLDIALTPHSDPCTPYGSIWVDIPYGTPAYTVSWSGPVSGSAVTNNNSYEILNLPSGTYDITVTDYNDCSDSSTTYLDNAEDEIDIFANPIPGLCSSDGSIWIDISDGTAPYTISWQGPGSGLITIDEVTYEITDLPTGSYTIVVNDGIDCYDMLTVYLNNDGNDLEVTVTPHDGPCGQYGSIWVDISGGSSPYAIYWSGPASGSVTIDGNSYEIPDLPNGTYDITVSDDNGCEDSAGAYINNTPDLEFVATPHNGICAQNGSIWIDISDGTAPYTISWQGPVSGSITIDDVTYEIPDLPAGNYAIVVNDGNDCYDMVTVYLNNEANDLEITATPHDGLCGQYGSIWVDISDGDSPYAIYWSGPVSGSVTIDGNSYEIPNLPNGTYDITVNDDNGCEDSASAYINNASDLEFVATPHNGICAQNGSIWIDISDGTAPYTISWQGPVSGSITTEDVTYEITDLPAGNYAIVVNDGNDCYDMVTVYVNIEEEDLNTVAVPINGNCLQAGSIWVDIFGGEATYTVEWEGPSSGSVSIEDTGFNIPNLPGGTYQITVTDDNGCSDEQIVELINAEDDLGVIVNPTNGLCGESGSIEVSIIGGVAPYFIYWDGPDAGSTNTNDDHYSISGLSSDTYTIGVTDDNGCSSSVSATLYNGSGEFDVMIMGFDGDCIEPNGLWVTVGEGLPPYTIEWIGPASGSITVSYEAFDVFDLPPGCYTIIVSDANGCMLIDSVCIDAVIDDLLINTTPLNGSCGLLGLIYVDITGGTADYSISWEGAGNSGSAVTSGNNYSVTSLESGNYNLTVTDANNCFDIRFMTIENTDDGPSAGFFYGSDTTTVFFTNQSSLGDYYWDFGDDNSSTEISPSHTFEEDGIYQVCLTVSNGCGEDTFCTYITLGDPSGMVEGIVQTYWGEGIADALVQIQGEDFSLSQITDEDGRYMLPDVPFGETYIIQPSKDTVPPEGLSTYGLLVGQRFILGMEPIEITSPYQVIAGDANCDGAFTTLDLFISQQVIIGAGNGFEQCPSWVFVSDDNSMPDDFDAYNVFPYHDRDSMMIMHDTVSSFVGVRVGDILGNSTPVFVPNELELMAENRSVEQGELFELNFRSSNFNDIVSYQMELDFDPEKLIFIDFEPSHYEMLSSVVAGTSATTDGALSISWFNLLGTGASVNQEEVLFTIHFVAVNDIDELFGLISIGSQFIEPQVHDANGEQLELKLGFENIVTSVGEAYGEKYKLYQNRPNPFNEWTVIGFDLPEDMEAELVIQDNLGKIVKRIKGNYFKGHNRLELSKLELGSGVYYYTFRTRDFTDTKNMVLLKR